MVKSRSVGNICPRPSRKQRGKGEIVDYQHFSTFLTLFSKDLFSMAVNIQDYLVYVTGLKKPFEEVVGKRRKRWLSTICSPPTMFLNVSKTDFTVWDAFLLSANRYGRPLFQAWLLFDLNTIPDGCVRENSL